MRIFIEDSFDSAHFLPKVGKEHKCSRPHGHTYRIRLEVAGPIDKDMGWIVDYTEVKDAWDLVKGRVDHRNLNDISGLENSTCENIAQWLWCELKQTIPGLARIELRETERCGVVYEG